MATTVIQAGSQNASRASPSLYVGDIAPDVTEALLFEVFNAVGPVASVRVCRDAATRQSLGYAYINFHRIEDAERALDTMNFKNIRGQPCRIMWSHRDPSLRKSGLGNIFVKNLAKSIDNKQLYDTFSMFGNILSCKVSQNAKGKSLGYGFVHYETEESAKNAIAKVNDKMIAGKKVNVCPFKAKVERGGTQNTFTNIYVKNIPLAWGDDELKAKFAEHGEVTSCVVSTNEDGSSKGFGFVNMEAPESAAKAVEALHELEVGEEKQKLHVVRAQKKEEREKELAERFRMLKVERSKKYAGVNLYVKNLSDTMSEEAVKAEFEKFGTIASLRIMRDSAGASKGFGFVCFTTPEEATKAVGEMNGKMLDQKPLYVALAQQKDVRRAQLEQQHHTRKNMMPQSGQMYPGQGMGMSSPNQMFYQPGMPQQRGYMYQPQMITARQWNMNQAAAAAAAQGGQMAAAQQGGQQMMGRPTNFHLMALGQRTAMNNRRGSGNSRGPNRHAAVNRAQPQQATPAEAEPAAAMPEAGEALTAKMLADAPEETKKQLIGERLFPLIQQRKPDLAGKITGMLLEMDNGELLHLLESPSALDEKVNEAMVVLDESG